MFLHPLCEDVNGDMDDCDAGREALTMLREDLQHAFPAGGRDRHTLLALEHGFKQPGQAKRPLVVRVLQKSSLLVFAAPSDCVGERHQLYMHVADETGTAVVVVWGSACRRYIGTVREGDVICIANYRAKRATAFTTAFAPVGMELSLNSKNPVGIIDLVTPSDAAEHFGVRMPVVAFQGPFERVHGKQPSDHDTAEATEAAGATSKQHASEGSGDAATAPVPPARPLLEWPSPLNVSPVVPRSRFAAHHHHVCRRSRHDQLLTTAGVVVRVGRLERRPKRKGTRVDVASRGGGDGDGGGDGGDGDGDGDGVACSHGAFYLNRWVVMRDPSAPAKEIVLSLAYNSQPRQFEAIKPGALLAVTNCRVREGGCVCVCVCVRAIVCVCVCECVRVFPLNPRVLLFAVPRSCNLSRCRRGTWAAACS